MRFKLAFTTSGVTMVDNPEGEWVKHEDAEAMLAEGMRTLRQMHASELARGVMFTPKEVRILSAVALVACFASFVLGLSL